MLVSDTRSPAYTTRLHANGAQLWKRVVPNPYAHWLRRQRPGFVLDVGCGIGRSLAFLKGNGVGVDHNPHSVEACRERGLRAYTPAEFQSSGFATPGRFDSLLCSHVLEHLDASAARTLLSEYVGYVHDGGQVIMITPQERGYRSDDSHVTFVNEATLLDHAAELGLRDVRVKSFPFVRSVGRIFPYNEFVAVGTVVRPVSR
jgi:2-polyprenyl-3-methyl-5-hydroxy-6-metoxy-1,4-benzoquinol methylase